LVAVAWMKIKVRMKTNNANVQYKSFLRDRRKRIDALLNRYLQKITQDSPKNLAKAMRYSVLGGGKRIRSLLIYAVGEIYKTDLKVLDAPAVAIEMIHSFSLIHDDLPAMDDDSLRRGKPTCHIAFDEATAILAGDALAIGAFQVLSEAKNLSAEKKAKMIKVLAEASGPRGMAGGQYIDLHAEGKKLSVDKLEQMYLLKTGVLIGAAIKLGALASDISGQKELKHLEQFALNIGLAFQIQDDVLNIESNATRLGKNVGTDEEHNKFTYPALVGMSAAKAKIKNLWSKAEKSLQQLKLENSILQLLTTSIMQRDF